MHLETRIIDEQGIFVLVFVFLTSLVVLVSSV